LKTKGKKKRASSRTAEFAEGWVSS